VAAALPHTRPARLLLLLLPPACLPACSSRALPLLRTSAGERHDLDEPGFALIDTLFSLAEAYLYAQLVEVHDARPGELPAGKTYADLYR
jgi:hypothetical protein